MRAKKPSGAQSGGQDQLSKEMNRLRNEKREVEIKFEISKLLYAELDYGRLLNLIIDKIMDILRAERGFIVTGEPADFQVKVARNIEGDELSEDGRAVSRTVVHKVLSSGEPSFINDAQQEGADSSRSIVDLGLRSIMCVPLLICGEPYGAIYVENRSMANCFMEKDLVLLQDLAELSASSIRNALNFLELSRSSGGSATSLGEDLRRDYDFSMIIGKSRKMVEVMEMAARVAPTDVTVLITGDSGTGKELIARAIYLNSTRKDKPFLTLNCGALPSGLLESELFGHVKGSFTGAYASKIGRFEAADGGTIFLDEVGEMPPELQVKLLRVLQFGEFEKVGSYRLQRVDVRIIAATNKKLLAMVGRGEFREDLYYRIKIIEVHFPPLRDRPDDIPLLIEHFIKMHAKKLSKPIESVDPQMMRLLQRYTYPGNIRELEGIIQRAMILSEKNYLSATDLPPEVLDSNQIATAADQAGGSRVIPVALNNDELKEAKEEATARATAEVEKAFLEAALEESGGVITKAAQKTGMNRSLFQRMVKKHGIQPKKKRNVLQGPS